MTEFWPEWSIGELFTTNLGLVYCAGDPPPWILKWAGLESSGQRLISSIGKTKRIAFFFSPNKIFSKFTDFKNREFLRFFQIFFSGLGWTGELWSNRINLMLRNKEYFFVVAAKIYFSKMSDVFRKKKDFLTIFLIFFLLLFLLILWFCFYILDYF